MLASLLFATTLLLSPQRPAAGAPASLPLCIDEYYNFEFTDAATCVRSLYQSHPSDPETIYWFTKVLWVSELDRSVDVNEDLLRLVLEKDPRSRRLDPVVRREFTDAVESGIRATSGQTSIKSMYFLGTFYGNQTAWDLILEGRKMRALSGVKRTMGQMRSVVDRDPSFMDAYTLLGMGNYLLGTNPWYVRFFTALAGTTGDKQQGIEQLRRASDAGIDDARFLYKSVLVREGLIREAVALIDDLLVRYPRNAFFTIEAGDLWASLGDRPRAIVKYQRAARLIEQSEILRRRFPAGYVQRKIAEAQREVR